MSNTLAFGKKAFTVAVVGATIAWAVGFSALVPLTASAASAGDLIKGSLPAVYALGTDLKRYVFPNEKTYKSWYSDFSGVKTISDTELAAIAIGGNVTYKASSATLLAVKITTSPTVYVVENGGNLRAIPDEATAKSLLGDNWNKKIHDIPDAFFTNYKVGSALATGAKLADLAAASASISADKSLAASAATPATTGALTASLASDSPASASAPYLAGNVIFGKILLSGTGDLKTVKVTRSGLSADADLSAVKLFDGKNQLGTTQTFDANHQAVFVFTTAVKVNGSLVITIAANIAAGGTATAGNTVQLGISAAGDIILVSGTVGGTFPLRGNAMTVSAATIGSLTVANTGGSNPTTDSNTDAGNTSPIVLLEARLSAGSAADLSLTRFGAQKAGTHISSDIGALELYDATNAKVLATLAGWDADSLVMFDLSAAPVKLLKGNSLNLQLRVPTGKVLAGSGRTLSARLRKTGSTFSDVSAIDLDKNLEVVADDGAANWDGTATAQTINAGSLTVVKSTTTPATGNLAPGAQNVKLAAWDMTVKGEDVRSTSTVFTFAAGTIATANVTACILRDKNGAAVAGPVDPVAAGAALINADTVTFSTTVTFVVGLSSFSMHCNLSSSVAGLETIAAGIIPSTGTTLTGVNSGNSVTATPATAVNGNTLTVKAGALTITNLTTPAASTVVTGAQNLLAAKLNFSASDSGEDIRITSITLTDTTGATADGDDIINITLKDASGKVLADIKQSSGTNAVGGDPTYAITLTTPLLITQSADVSVSVYVDAKAGIAAGDIGATESHTFSAAAVADVVATGVTTGTTLAAGSKTLNGAGQALTIAAAGTLTTSLDSSSPTSSLVVAGTDGVIVSVFKFVGASEDVQLRKLQITRTGGADADVSKVYLYDGDTKLGEAVLSAGVATIDIASKNFIVDRFGNPRRLTVKSDFNTITATATKSGGATSNNQPRFDLTALLGTADGAAVGLASGSGVAITAVTTGATWTVRKTSPTFTKTANNSTTMVPSATAKVLEFSISANAGADVIFDKGPAVGFAAGDGRLRFTISQNGGTTTAKTVTLKKADGTILDTFTYDLTTASGVLDFNFSTNGLTASAGKSETLFIEVDTTDYATQSEYFGITLADDASNTIAGTDNVRWSDDSSSTVDLNGFGLAKNGLSITNTMTKP